MVFLKVESHRFDREILNAEAAGFIPRSLTILF